MAPVAGGAQRDPIVRVLVATTFVRPMMGMKLSGELHNMQRKPGSFLDVSRHQSPFGRGVCWAPDGTSLGRAGAEPGELGRALLT